MWRMNRIYFAFCLLLITLAVEGCTSGTGLVQEQPVAISASPEGVATTPVPTQSISSTATPLPTISPTSTVTPVPATITPMPTPTARWQIDVTEFVAIGRCDASRDKEIVAVVWKNDTEFIYGYHPITLTTEGCLTSSEIYWMTHNIETGEEMPAESQLNFDCTFWERNQIVKYTAHPEYFGFFSPSGKYVIYTVSYGSLFDVNVNSKTEIWVAETHGQSRWKIQEIGGSGVYIHRAAWFDDETRVIFDTSYEGPSEFYVSEFKTGVATPLSEMSEFSGVTEETWRLSPDGHLLAVVEFPRELLLVSLDTGQATVVEPYGGSFPQWSEDGTYLFYWWRADRDSWWGEMDELRAYHLATGEITTILDKASLIAGFRGYEGDNICVDNNCWLGGFPYAVSPDQRTILLWDYFLYIIRIK